MTPARDPKQSIMYCNLQQIWNLIDFGVRETSHSEITTRKYADKVVRPSSMYAFFTCGFSEFDVLRKRER